MCFGYMVIVGNFVLLPLWLQTQPGYTATWAGLDAASVLDVAGARVGRMSIAARLFGLIVIAMCLPLPSRAEAPVVVIRGTQQSTDAGVSTQREQGVLVMRPAPDSFLRETRRLAAAEDARNARAANEPAALVEYWPVVVRPWFPVINDDYFYWTSRWRSLPPRPAPRPPKPAPPVRPHNAAKDASAVQPQHTTEAGTL